MSIPGRKHADVEMSLPSVGICIPTYNQAAFLRLSVASALCQTYRGPLEVWVGDDASTDDTDVVLGELTDGHANVHVVRNSANVGIAENVNRLLRQPKTDLIVRLDSDDLLKPEYVERLGALMAATPLAGYGHTQVEEIDESGRVVRVRRLRRDTGLQEAEAALRASLSGYRTVANILMFRRSALEQLSYCDGRPEYVEDYDLAVRMADAGYGNIFVAETLASYRVWADAAGLRARRKGLQLDGYRRIFDETFTPAWERRGWDRRQLARRRNRLAALHCASCFAPQYAPQERDELVALLLRLGSGVRVRIRICLCRVGLTPVLRFWDGLPAAIKRVAKLLLAVARRFRDSIRHT